MVLRLRCGWKVVAIELMVLRLKVGWEVEGTKPMVLLKGGLEIEGIEPTVLMNCGLEVEERQSDVWRDGWKVVVTQQEAWRLLGDLQAEEPRLEEQGGR